MPISHISSEKIFQWQSIDNFEVVIKLFKACCIKNNNCKEVWTGMEIEIEEPEVVAEQEDEYVEVEPGFLGIPADWEEPNYWG